MTSRSTRWRIYGLNQKAVQPALEEVNALAEFTLWVEARKSGRKVTDVVIDWQNKGALARAEAARELDLSRVGRKARLRSEVERVEIAALLS